MRSRVWGAFFLLICTILMTSLSAATVSTVNLPGLVENSDRAFFGLCVSAESEIEERTGFLVSVYEFRVLEPLKGVEAEQLITVRQLDASNGFGIAGLPTYRKGQRVLMFLHANSRLGLTSPVGMLQGVFHSNVSQEGAILLMNGVRNRNLAHELNARGALSVGLSQDDYDLLKRGEPISLSSFRDFVSRIQGHLRNQREEIE